MAKAAQILELDQIYLTLGAQVILRVVNTNLPQAFYGFYSKPKFGQISAEPTITKIKIIKRYMTAIYKDFLFKI